MPDNKRKGHATWTRATVDDDPVVLLKAANKNRISLTIYNHGSVTVFLGGLAVTALTGFPLLAQESLCDNDSQSAVYGITSASSTDLAVCEVA